MIRTTRGNSGLLAGTARYLPLRCGCRCCFTVLRTGQDGLVTTNAEDPVVEVISAPDAKGGETVEAPAKVLRIGSMIKQLLDEARAAPLDEASRSRIREIYETSVKELAEGLSPDLRDELNRLTLPFDTGVPTEAELRIAQAQLVGWLE